MTIDEAFVPRLSKKARLRFDRHAQKDMLVYPERGLELNASAAAILRKIDGKRSVGEIARELAEELGAPEAEHATIAADVVSFVASLHGRGLLVP